MFYEEHFKYILMKHTFLLNKIFCINKGIVKNNKKDT